MRAVYSMLDGDVQSVVDIVDLGEMRYIDVSHLLKPQKILSEKGKEIPVNPGICVQRDKSSG